MKLLKRFFLPIIGTLSILVGLLVWHEEPASSLRLDFFDVGQGDAIMITLPFPKYRILVDAGPKNELAQKISEVLPWYDRRIDMIVLTHPHADHLSGFFSLLDSLTIDAVLLTGIRSDEAMYEKFLEKLSTKKLNVFLAKKDIDYQIGPLILDVLYPSTYLAFQESKNLNHSSIVLRLSYAGKSILLSGDAEKINEEILLQEGAPLSAEILKIGHHGSKSASSLSFVTVVSPLFSVIQSGAGNMYGHPHQETIEILRNTHSKILRNDLLGDVVIFINKSGEIDFSPLSDTS